MTVGLLFETLERRLLQHLVGFCNSRAAAEDALSQAFVRAVEHMELLESLPEKAARAWLYAAARNAAIDAARRDRRLIDDPEGYERLAAPDGLSGVLLGDALGVLTPQQRRIVLLRHGGGYTSAEIGGRLGMSESTVRYHLASAVRQIRCYYEGESPP